jgi:Phosphotransferase enzyme family
LYRLQNNFDRLSTFVQTTSVSSSPMTSSSMATPQEENTVPEEASDHNEQDEDMAIFEAVHANIQLDHVPSFVLGVRKRIQKTKGVDSNMRCDLQKEPLWGGFHILYLITFTDGVKWLLKVPATGHSDHFDAGAARSLTSEALTMRFLKRETTIPIPEVYHFDASLDNELHVPFILIEYIDGVSCQDMWFNDRISKELLEQHRLRALEDVAKSMLQLGRFAYGRGGQPMFDSEGNLQETVAPIRVLDNAARLKRAETEDANSEAIHYIFRETGPYDDPSSYLFAPLDREPPSEEDEDEFGTGMDKLLRFFLECVLENARPEATAKFVLAHPDFDSQNFIFSDDGKIRGIIDWDGVVSKPRCLGNEVYPGWLTRDWDPAMYGYFMPDCPNPENSPAELEHYRKAFRDIVKKLKERQQDVAASNEIDVVITTQSLVVENLYIAADNQMCRYAILDKIFKEIARIVAPEIYQEMEESEKQSRIGGACLDHDSSFAEGSQLGPADVDKDENVKAEQTCGDETPSGDDAAVAAVAETEAEGPAQAKSDGDNDSDAESTGERGEDDEEGEEDAHDDSGVPEFRFYDVCVALAKNALEDEMLKMLKDGFSQLLAGG